MKHELILDNGKITSTMALQISKLGGQRGFRGASNRLLTPGDTLGVASLEVTTSTSRLKVCASALTCFRGLAVSSSELCFARSCACCAALACVGV